MKLGQSRPVRSDDAVNFLRQLGQAGDGPHDIARAALMLAALDHANRSLDSYLAHLDEVAAEASREAKAVGAAEEAIQKLIALLRGRFGYDGDRLSYDDPRNADLIEVIERRRGLPVALGILFLHAARAAGYTATGLSAPVHFLVRISTVAREAYETCLSLASPGQAWHNEAALALASLKRRLN